MFGLARTKTRTLNKPRKNSHHVIPKGGVRPRNLLLLGSREEKQIPRFARFTVNGMTNSTFSAAYYSRATLLLLQIIANHRAAFHHEFHALHFGDVLQRISGHGHEVGKPALLNVADLFS